MLLNYTFSNETSALCMVCLPKIRVNYTQSGHYNPENEGLDNERNSILAWQNKYALDIFVKCA